MSATNWETSTFFALVVMFGLWEWFRPARAVDKFAELKLDVLSFVLAVIMARVSRHTVDELIAGISPEFIQASLAEVRSWPGGVKILVALVVVDFTIYWIHRAQHRFEFMWRTHKWHHSIREMYWFSGFRTSFAHSFIYNIPQTVIPIQFLHLSALETGMAYSLGLFIQFWEHTNVRVNIGWLKHIFITPQYHRVHHSATDRRGMNLGTTFSIWDRLFHTYVDPDTLPDDYPLGLGEDVEEKEVPRMLIGM